VQQHLLVPEPLAGPASAADYYTHAFNVPQGVFIENAGCIYETSQVLEVVGSLLTVLLPLYPGPLPSTTAWDVAQD
jgi:hypothetical protein